MSEIGLEQVEVRVRESGGDTLPITILMTL